VTIQAEELFVRSVTNATDSSTVVIGRGANPEQKEEEETRKKRKQRRHDKRQMDSESSDDPENLLGQDASNAANTNSNATIPNLGPSNTDPPQPATGDAAGTTTNDLTAALETCSGADVSSPELELDGDTADLLRPRKSKPRNPKKKRSDLEQLMLEADEAVAKDLSADEAHKSTRKRRAKKRSRHQMRKESQLSSKETVSAGGPRSKTTKRKKHHTITLISSEEESRSTESASTGKATATKKKSKQRKKRKSAFSASDSDSESEDSHPESAPSDDPWDSGASDDAEEKDGDNSDGDAERERVKKAMARDRKRIAAGKQPKLGYDIWSLARQRDKGHTFDAKKWALSSTVERHPELTNPYRDMLVRCDPNLSEAARSKSAFQRLDVEGLPTILTFDLVQQALATATMLYGMTPQVAYLTMVQTTARLLEIHMLYPLTVQVDLVNRLGRRIAVLRQGTDVGEALRKSIEEATKDSAMRHIYRRVRLSEMSRTTGGRTSTSRHRSSRRGQRSRSSRSKSHPSRASTALIQQYRNPDSAGYIPHGWCVEYWARELTCTDPGCTRKHRPRWTPDEKDTAAEAARNNRPNRNQRR